MKKRGLVGFAVAATCMGDVTLALSSGSETESGKLFDPFGYGGLQVDCGGSQAGGAGSALVLGDQVIGTAGVDGYDGCGGGGFVLDELVPHPAKLKARNEITRISRSAAVRTLEKNERIHQPP